MNVSRNSQFSALNFQRCITVLCLLMLLVCTSAEALHTHRDRAMSRDGTPCLVCFSLHATAPAVKAHSLPVLFAVAMIAVPYEVQANGITSRLELFTRPPPIA